MNRVFKPFFALLLGSLVATGFASTGFAQERLLALQESAPRTAEFSDNAAPERANLVANKVADKNAAEKEAADKDAVDKDATDKDAAKKDNAGSAAAPATPECKLCRWLDVQNVSFSFRYKTIVDSVGNRTFNQGAHRELITGRFKFDKEGKYSINAHVSSGYYFNWAYADAIGGGMPEAFEKVFLFFGFPKDQARAARSLGAQSGGYNLFVRQLYFSAKPVKGVELQYGSLPILRGQHSETTSYDDDGYVAGQRLSLKRPDKLFFDEISVTYAFLGKTDRMRDGKRYLIDDVYTPNFFRRWRHLGTSNYHQFLVQKKIGSRATVSADYTYNEQVDVMREAATVDVHESKLLDSLRVEAYQRVGDHSVFVPAGFGAPARNQVIKAANGVALTGQKRLGRVKVGGGYSNVDFDYSNNRVFYTGYSFALNGDRMGVGQRYFFTGELKLSNDINVTTFYTNAFNIPTGRTLFNREHFNVAVNFDLLKSLKKTGLF